MLNTAALLKIAFAMISNFTNAVAVPPEFVPTQPADLDWDRCHFGAMSPDEVFLTTRSGAKWTIEVGVVNEFEAPHAFHPIGESPPHPAVPMLTSNEVFELAVRTVTRLVKWGEPLSSPPAVAGGPTVFSVTWPTRQVGLEYAAKVRIDARTGHFMYIQLGTWEFVDQRKRKAIIDEVYQSETPPFSVPVAERPREEEVAPLLLVMGKTCRQLDIDIGPNTNLASINWSLCHEYADTNGLGTLCHVVFTNYSECYFASNCVIGYPNEKDESGFYSWNGLFWSPPARIAYEWTGIAAKFEQNLRQFLGSRARDLDGAKPYLQTVAPPVGSFDSHILRVFWYRFPMAHPRKWTEGKLIFLADVDLATGRTRGFSIEDPALCKSFIQCQQDEKR